MAKLSDFLSDRNTLSLQEQKALLRAKLVVLRETLKKNAPEKMWGPQQVELFWKTLKSATGKLPEDFDIAAYFAVRSELNVTHHADPRWLFPYSATDRSLRWFKMGEENDLKPNRFGIPERELSKTFVYTASMKPMVMFVPCLAASEAGIRLGYGGGYYDRFLEKFSHRILSVCCLHSELLFDELPTETFDTPVDCLVTENKVLFREPIDQLLCKLRT